VDCERDKQHVLALVAEPHGKKNWWIVDQRGHRMSIAPKDISWVLPGTQYTAADLDRFLQTAASDGGDLSLLEIAWAVAVDEGAGKSYSLAEMSELLFDSSTPLSQYTTYHMLLKDAVYFKQAKGPLLYEPRTADAVAAAQAVAAAAAAKLAAQAAHASSDYLCAEKERELRRERGKPFLAYIKGACILSLCMAKQGKDCQKAKRITLRLSRH